ncbi:hypothetical protein [Butyrivibrio sp. FCS014]|uniref:hypothetical protein n=1 Tax=Butyrivibrio sp. FCS014 TaxID=1408304 RepID=UPI000462F0E6|nr:hypothetical protein [Butyrivibrio sp. FCS014]
MDILKKLNLNIKFNMKAFVEILVASAITIGMLSVFYINHRDDGTTLSVKLGVFAFFQPIILMVTVFVVDTVTEFEANLFSIMLSVCKQMLKLLFFCFLPASIISMGILFLVTKFVSIPHSMLQDLPYYIIAITFFVWTNLYCYVNASKELS